MPSIGAYQRRQRREYPVTHPLTDRSHNLTNLNEFVREPTSTSGNQLFNVNHGTRTVNLTPKNQTESDSYADGNIDGS